MKLTATLLLTLLLGIRCHALAGPPPPHQWVQLPLPNAQSWCDLAQASKVRVVGDRATAEQSFVTADGSAEAYYLFEDNEAVAQIVLKAVQSTPERWLRVDPGTNAVGAFLFVNLEAVTAVYFQTDEKGAYARVILRGQSVMDPHRVSKNLSAGYEVRTSADVTRLKALFNP